MFRISQNGQEPLVDVDTVEQIEARDPIEQDGSLSHR